MASQKWLTPDEQRAWMGLVAVTTLLDAALDQQLQRDAGISHGTYAILTALSAAPDRMLHMSDLAVLTSSSQSRLSHAVARLESSGWVTRAKCASDKRQVDARLTEAGQRVLIEAAPGHVRRVRELVFDRLDAAQVEQLAALTSVLVGSLADAGFASPLPQPT